MWRLVLAAIIAGGLALAGSTPAAAVDREEPVVPPAFLMRAPAPAPIPAEDTTIRFRLALTEPGVVGVIALPDSSTSIRGGYEPQQEQMAWPRYAAPGPVRDLGMAGFR